MIVKLEKLIGSLRTFEMNHEKEKKDKNVKSAALKAEVSKSMMHMSGDDSENCQNQ